MRLIWRTTSVIFIFVLWLTSTMAFARQEETFNYNISGLDFKRTHLNRHGSHWVELQDHYRYIEKDQSNTSEYQSTFRNYASARVNLPQGAIVTNFICYAMDRSVDQKFHFSARLFERHLDFSQNSSAIQTIAGHVGRDNSIEKPIINNNENMYSIWLEWDIESKAPNMGTGGHNLRFYGCTISYKNQ